MFNSISWGTYLIFLAIASITYYSYVGLTYYKKELVRIFNGKHSYHQEHRTFDSLLSQPASDNTTIQDEHFFEEETDMDDDSLSAQLKRVLALFIERSAYAQSPKTELMFGIHFEITKEKYNAMVDTDEQQNINEWIIDACERHCSIQLEEDEVQQLWIR